MWKKFCNICDCLINADECGRGNIRYKKKEEKDFTIIEFDICENCTDNVMNTLFPRQMEKKRI